MTLIFQIGFILLTIGGLSILFLKSAFEIIKANMANLKDAFIKLVFKKFLVFIKLTIVNFFQLINASLALYEMIFSWILEITESTTQIFNLRVLRDIEILILFHVLIILIGLIFAYVIELVLNINMFLLIF